MTGTLGGPDPTTYSVANPCGSAGQGVLNTNETVANGAVGVGGCAAQGTNASDKTRYGIYYDQFGNRYPRSQALRGKRSPACSASTGRRMTTR